MKKLLIFLSLGSIFSSLAKDIQKLDTIYANSTMTTALFFPSNIKQGITGSDYFIFTYNREKEQNLGLLKAVKGIASNLLVITTDGKVYSYIIGYSEKLEYPNRFIDIAESIGDEKRTSKKEIEKKKSSKDRLPDNDIQDQLRRSCISLLNLPERKNNKKKKNDISLGLKNLYCQGNNIFVQFEINNNSGIRFDLDFLRIYKVNGNRKRRGSYQELLLKPILIHNLPNMVGHGETVRFVYVLPKFFLDKNEKILVKLRERKTSRAVNLKWR